MFNSRITRTFNDNHSTHSASGIEHTVVSNKVVSNKVVSNKVVSNKVVSTRKNARSAHVEIPKVGEV